MADYEKHQSLNVNHSKTEETDMTVQVMNPAVRSNTREGQFGPQTNYPVDITINEISSIGGAHVWDGSKQIEPQTETTYTWWVPENTFNRITAKECNSEGSEFIISRPASNEAKDSQISILRAKSGGPNGIMVTKGDSENATANNPSSSTGSPRSNGQYSQQAQDPADEMLNILGIAVECYVLTDRFLNSPRIKEINERRELIYDVQDYLKLFQYFQFKFRDGLGYVKEPHLPAFKTGFEKYEEAVREATAIARAKEEVIEEETKAKVEAEKPVSAGNASDVNDDDLPF